MKLRFVTILAALVAVTSIEAAPLRVFVRAGVKTHGPGAHDHPSFLKDWVPLMNERGIKADGALEFPTAAQLDNTDVLILHCDQGGTMSAEQQALIEKFAKRGGGVVAIHAGSVSKNHDWYRKIVGGSWHFGQTKWFEGAMSLYFTDAENPITREASNFDLEEDEIYYDMDIEESVKVLAAAYTPNPKGTRNAKAGNRALELTAGGKRVSVYDIQPQMWSWENKLEGGEAYRAFVSIPGHMYVTFARPNYRAILLRGIAWAGKRANVDEFCSKEELASLRYPQGGPSAPAKSLTDSVVHPEFKATIVASEPLVNKVMNVDWDPQGRMWCVETPEYPNGRRAPRVEAWKDSGSLVKSGDVENRKPVDKISYVEDTNGDGVADKKVIFHEGLELVTSMVFHQDGVIVSQAPDILFLRDTDGDGKADKVEKLYTGLGNGDTHAVINNLRWGFDGWIYAAHGYSGGSVKSPDGSKVFGTIGSGVARFKPDGSAFEQVSSKGGNTWGLDITWDNEIFFTQPTSGQVFMHVVAPESVLAKGRIGKVPSYKANVVGQKSFPLINYEKQAYVQIDQVGKFTAAAGCAIYDGGSWPAKWNGSYFTTEPTINIIHHQFVTPEGPTYSSAKEAGREETEFIGSRDYWWRPIETRIGPDGALYICDFYNQAVIHNDTRGPHHGPANAALRPDRDHYFARIWRVDHKDAQKLAVPKLSAKSSAAELVASLEHPNSHVRDSAFRLLVESHGNGKTAELLAKTVKAKKSPEARVAALWALHRMGFAGLEGSLAAALSDGDAALRKNAAQIAGLIGVGETSVAREDQLAKLLDDENPRVRLQAIIALGNGTIQDATISKLVAVFASATDDWTKSAVAGVAAGEPAKFLAAAMSSADSAAIQQLITALSASLADTKNPDAVAKTVISLAAQPASADATKQSLLPTLVSAPRPEWSGDLQKALGSFLASPNIGVAVAALPLVAAWDGKGTLANEAAGVIGKITAMVNDASVPEMARAQLASSLLAARGLNPGIVPTAIKSLGAIKDPAAQTRLANALGDTGDATVAAEFVSMLPKATDAGLREALLNQITRRADWSLALLAALKEKKITLTDLGPVALGRLRAHPDQAVAKQALVVIEELRGPQSKMKDELVAKVVAASSQPADLAKGKALFDSSCLICHAFKGAGKKEFAPDLTGMGLHGAEVLLTAILDPNREVDPAFVAQAITTKKGESYSGIIVREAGGTVLLRHAGGDVEIKKDEIQTRTNTGLSLMPEGFEALGVENLRDMVAYLSADQGNFRVLDLTKVFTSDSRRGLYMREEDTHDNLIFTKFGIVNVKGVPFMVIDPAKNPTGRNVLTLKGGHGYAKTLPQRVEVKVGFAASRLHFLGGVAGWAAKEPMDGVPVFKAVVVYSDGQEEELIAKDGVEFADYIGDYDVPGSVQASGLVQGHQVRAFTRVLKRTNVVIDRIRLESFNNGVAPTTVGITAETGAGAANLTPSPAALEAAAAVKAAIPKPFSGPVPKPPASANGPRILIVGGGSSHNFDKFFNESDKAVLATGKPGWLDYTDNANGAPEVFANVDLLVWSANQKITDDTAKALKAWADAGKPLVLLHPGVWYNWPNFAAWNKEIVGGGSKGHDKIQEFEVKTVNANHPVMAGVSASFKITDELYYVIPDEAGTPIEVLATATSPQSGKTFPSVWIVKHPKAKIACIAPGHDARAHDLPEYKKLLQNAVNWTLGK